MQKLIDINEMLRGLFRNPNSYDFFLAPTLIRPVVEKDTSSKWTATQKSHEANVLDPSSFSEERIFEGFKRFEKIFSTDTIKGTVLDVGGGWGLLRQWHDGHGQYVVHDPGIRRILAGPHAHYRKVYKDAFARPASFVIEYGESLPYRDGVFDSAILKETLDHCENPELVLRNVNAALGSGGRLIIINHLASQSTKQEKRERISQVLRSPKRLAGALRRKLAGDHHLWHFTPESLSQLAHETGFVPDREVTLDRTTWLPKLYVGMWRAA